MATTTRTDESIWAQLEPLLPHVRKPARYVGGEDDIVVKDHATCRSAWLLVHPDADEPWSSPGLDLEHQTVHLPIVCAG